MPNNNITIVNDWNCKIMKYVLYYHVRDCREIINHNTVKWVYVSIFIKKKKKIVGIE